jgi:hypothetical protein
MRLGSSIARAAFNEIPAPLKPMVLPAQTRKVQEESQTAGEVIAERDQLREYAESGYLEIESYTRRPASANFMYCGVDEFNGQYYCCEVKNQNNSCAQFTPRGSDSVSHPCETCQHRWQAPNQLVLTLEETLGRDKNGKELRDQVRQQLEHQAQEEYESCIDGAGFLQRRPGVLPLCEARSTDSGSSGPSFVVGPIVNDGKRCGLWAAGSNLSQQRAEAQLQAYVARSREAAAVRKQPGPYLNPYADPLAAGNPADQIQALQEIVANAEADLVEFCLLTLGADPSVSESVATRFSSDVWFAQRRSAMPIESGAPHLERRPVAPLDATVEPARQAEPSEPFLVETGVLYKHPETALAFFTNPDTPDIGVLRTTWDPLSGVPFGADEADAAEVVGRWPRTGFEPGIWTQLHDNDLNPLPLTLNVQPSGSIYAAWY